VCTATAAYLKIFSGDPKVGFFAHAVVMQNSIRSGIIMPSAKTASQMARMLVNDRIDGVICALFLGALTTVTMLAVARCWSTGRDSAPVPTEGAVSHV
jgi:carbon starvation protein